MSYVDPMPNRPPTPRLTPDHLRWVADLVERDASATPSMSVRDALAGLAGSAMGARPDDAEDELSALALATGVFVLDQVLGEGIEQYERDSETDPSGMTRMGVLAAADTLSLIAHWGSAEAPPTVLGSVEIPAGNEDAAAEMLISLPVPIVRWLQTEAQRRAGPSPGPSPRPKSVDAAGNITFEQPWPTPEEEEAIREHRREGRNISSVVEDAVRALMESPE